VRGVIVPTNTAVAPEFAKIYGEEQPASEAGLIAVPRAGQPSLWQKPNVPLEFEHLVKVEG
jgi:hypothetical protein